jgi:uncharacterized protein
MSRHRTRPPAPVTATPGSAAPPSVDPDGLPVAATSSADELHRLAVARREQRMGRGARPAGAPAAAATAVPAPAMGTVVTVLPVRGMTCRSCEVRIQRHVGRLAGVEKVTASATRGRVTVESSGPLSGAAVAKAIGLAGYEVGDTPWLERDPAAWVTAAAGVALVAVLALVAGATGVADLASGAGDLDRGGLVVALLLGLAAGVSTCMAMVGGLVLALTASFQANGSVGDAGGPGSIARMRPALVFMAGRIVGYGVFGALLGAVGASVAMPPQLTAVLMLVVAVVMTILGTRLTGLSPRIAGWSPTLPLGLGRRLGLADGSAGAYSDGRAALLGAASFFLPCGFTQAVQVYALSTGSPALAGALLATFAIGTAPGLLALAGLPVVVPARWRPTLLRLVGVVVLGFALVNATAGLRLAGVSLPVGAAPAVASVATAADGTQALTTYQDVDGYSPQNVAIYAGTPTHWTIQSRSTASCAASLVVPGLNISRRLQVGANTIDLPALSAGTVYYSCSMGMYSGAITVVDRPADTTGSATGG